MFIAEVATVDGFIANHEALERKLVPVGEVLDYCTGVNFRPIFEYFVQAYSDAFTKR